MPSTVKLPATKRIEGHGRVSLYLGDDGLVNGAHFDVTEFRGFETMLEGRMVWEMPLITSRICGVCPVSHHLAAVKAVDALLGVDIPPAARMLREILHLGGFAQDHALHFFFLAGPDFLLGDGTAARDLLGVVAADPELAKRAIALRRAGQRVVEIVGGRTSHPVTAIPGGMSRGITEEDRAELQALTAEILAGAIPSAELARESTERLLAQHPEFSAEPVSYLAQMRGSVFDLYDGEVRVMGPNGEISQEWPVTAYASHIAEESLPHSYANAPYLTALGPDAGAYRVGPLARLNIADTMPGPRSQELLNAYRATLGRPVHAVLAYHWTRMIELVATAERLDVLLADDEVISPDVRVKVDRADGVGIAAVEAPRGTLIHHYEADPVGKVTKANLIVATTHNIRSLDTSVLDAVVGSSYDGALPDDVFRRMELGIRAHDPCLSCATHEIGRMPLVVEVVSAQGVVLERRGVS